MSSRYTLAPPLLTLSLCVCVCVLGGLMQVELNMLTKAADARGITLLTVGGAYRATDIHQAGLWGPYN
jgi:hypothetical protein